MLPQTVVSTRISSYYEHRVTARYEEDTETVSVTLADGVQLRGDYDDVRERLLEALDEMARQRWSPEGRTPLTGKVTA